MFFKSCALVSLTLLTACAAEPPRLNKVIVIQDDEDAQGAVIENPDGSKTVKNPDGSKTITRPDGTKTTVPKEDTTTPPDGQMGGGEMTEDKPGTGIDNGGGGTNTRPAFSGRGMNMPWDQYEAEDGKYQGELLKASRDVGEFSAEASARKAVRLSKTGDYVAVKAIAPGNSIVVRLAIPDSPDGKGLDSTLGVYVNGKRVKSLAVTSKYSWMYGDENHPSNSPGGTPRRMFDESNILLDDFPAGAEIKVQKDAMDSAAYYVIDLIDLEKVAPEKKMPAGFLSIADFGAVPNNGRDNLAAFQRALEEAGKQKKGLWIPKGDYYFERKFTNTGLNVQMVNPEIEIRGAGMWYSRLTGPGVTFACGGSGCKYYDFAIFGGTVDRVDVNRADNGFNDGAGRGSVLENIWVEHVKVGFWVGKHHTQRDQGLKTTNLQVRNSRFRNLFADGINLSNGTSDSIIENNHFRYTGDDGIAIWSQENENPSPDPIATNNIIKNNTVQIPWRANCYAIYGSKNLKMIDNTCYDTLTYPGFFAADTFPSFGFEGTNVVKGLTLVRAGGAFWNKQKYGALKLFTVGQEKIQNFQFEDIDIEEPTYSGIQIEGSLEFSNISFKNVKIKKSLEDGIHIKATARSGAINFENVTIEGSAGKALNDETNNSGSPSPLIKKGAGNSGW